MLAKTESSKLSPSSPGSPEEIPPPSAPKRPHSDAISETLIRLEEQQKEHSRLLQQLVHKQKEVQVKKPVAVPDCEELTFESAFQTFLASFRKLPNEERPYKLRKILVSANEMETDSLNEIVDVFQSVATNLPLSDSDMNMKCSENECLCLHCPHKQQLRKLDDFYAEFISDPTSSPLSF